MDMTLVVLAAGQSTRYGALKQLDEFGPHGESLMDYAVYDAHRVGLSRVVIVTRNEILPKIAAHVERYRDHVAVEIALQQTSDPHSGTAARRSKPWGTGHAVLSVEPFVTQPFIVINADDFYGGRPYDRMVAHLFRCNPNDPTFALVPFPLRATLSPSGGVSRGVCTVSGNEVTEIVETVGLRQRGNLIDGTTLSGKSTSHGGEEPVSMNYWGFTPAIFPLLADEFSKFRVAADGDDEFPISDTLNVLLREHRAHLTRVEAAGEWCGVTYPGDRSRVVAALERLTAAGVYPTPLFPACN